jgi:hypothetical protein
VLVLLNITLGALPVEAHPVPLTVNNVLTVLNVVLRKAVEWNVLERMPCTSRALPTPKSEAGFSDFDECDRPLR